jgi:O-antigen/teichoic acid export membrane protein
MDNSAQGTTGKPLIHSIAWNYAGYFAEFATGVLLLAYVVRHISVADYGVFLLAQAVAAFLYIVDFGLSNVSVQFYAEKLARAGVAKVGAAASTFTVALLGAGTLAAIALNALAHFVPRIVHLQPHQRGLALQVLVVVSAGFVLDAASAPLEHLCQTFHLFDRTNQVRIALMSLRVVLTVAALQMNTGIVGLAVVQALLSLVRLTVLWCIPGACISGLKLHPASFDWSVIRDAFAMSKWAFGDDLARRIGMSAQSMILAAFASVSQVALFGMASKLPTHMYTFAARGLDVTLPTLSHSHHQDDTDTLRRVYGSAFRLCITGMLPIATFAAICARPLLIVWAGAPYATASAALVWLLASALTQALMLPSDIVLYTHGQIPLAARFSLIETAAKIALPVCLVFRFGVAGVAAGVALAHCFVHLCFYLPAACHIAEITPGSLLREARRGSAATTATFALGAIMLAFCAAALQPVLAFVMCIVAALIYAGVWITTIALPLITQRETKLVQEVLE